MSSWSARVRDPAGRLADPLEFTGLTLVENYLTPHVLVLVGDIDGLRPALATDFGVVITDGSGNQRFSGNLQKVSRSGDNTAELTYHADSELLWQRLCWPTPANAWDGQLTAYDVLTGPAETRMLSLINRNAGPAAWHEVSGSADPGSTISFSPFAILDPTSGYISQACAPDPDSTDLYLTQKFDDDDILATPDNLWITRFVLGVQHSQMYLPRGGHGDLLEVRRVKGKVHIVFRYRGVSGTSDISGTWVSLPWTPGKTWTAKQALVYKIPTVKGAANPQPLMTDRLKWGTDTGVPYRTLPDRHSWFQGEARYGSTFYRMYGTPYDNSGPITTAMPPYIDVIRNNAIVDTIDVSQLGRDGGGLPFDNYVEPEGLAIARGEDPALLIGMVTGHGAARRHRLYTMPLNADDDDDRLADRRGRRVRIPSTLGRGDVGTTSVRFETLGQVVTELAEANDLSVDIVQTWDGTGSHRDVVVTSTPDLTDSVQIGGPGDSGDIVLGSDWMYSVELPVATTVLSAAGGEGAARILTARSDRDAERTWDARVEQLVDQRDTTDDGEILQGLTQALVDGAGVTELAIPLLVVNDDALGTSIPLGARVAAVIDGDVVTERIRQITTELGGSGGETQTVTAVLGTPDAGTTRTSAQIAALLKRVRNLEAR